MVSNFDNKTMRAIPEDLAGRRHFQLQKKTSLFGSETPRDAKPRHSHKHGNPSDIITSGEKNIMYESDIHRQRNEEDSFKFNDNSEKRATLAELQSYDPWGKPGCGAPNSTLPTDAKSHHNNRVKWEYEKQLKSQPDSERDQDPSYPGFGGTFGAGVQSKNDYTKQKSDFGNDGDGKQNSSFDALGLRPSDSSRNGEKEKEPTYKSYEDAKAYADYLEKEIQRLKMKQQEDVHSLDQIDRMREENGYHQNQQQQQQQQYHDLEDSRDRFDREERQLLEAENDSIAREAEYRARMRELDRARERNHGDGGGEGSENGGKYTDLITMDQQQQQQQQNQQYHHQPPHQQKRVSSSNRNDFRQYTKEEYMNSRPSPINPSLLKRTTLSGSENMGHNGSEFVDVHRYGGARQPSQNNIFHAENNALPAAHSQSAYKMKAPFATD